MLPKAEDLLSMVERKINEDKSKKIEQFINLLKNVLSDIYDYPKTLKYGKLLTYNELVKYFDELGISHDEYHTIKDDVVKLINTNTDLYAYNNISGIIISWHPDSLIKKTDSDINLEYAIVLSMRIDVEELQVMSKSEINKQKEKENGYFDIYVKDIINSKILNATSNGETECVINGEDIDNYVEIKGLSETRHGKVVIQEIASYIDTETEYYTKLDEVRIKGQNYWGNRMDYKIDNKLTIKWDMYSLKFKKDKKDKENKEELVEKDLRQINERTNWFTRILNYFK